MLGLSARGHRPVAARAGGVVTITNLHDLADEDDAPELPHVWPDAARPRSEFEERTGCDYCRRCGRMLSKDRDPSWQQMKPCRVVRITHRAGAS